MAVGSPEAFTNRNVMMVIMISTGIICKILRSIYFSITFLPLSFIACRRFGHAAVQNSGPCPNSEQSCGLVVRCSGTELLALGGGPSGKCRQARNPGKIKPDKPCPGFYTLRMVLRFHTSSRRGVMVMLSFTP